jgi:hypothetical protein
MKRKRKLESDEGKHEAPQKHHKQVHVPPNTPAQQEPAAGLMLLPPAYRALQHL